MRAPGPCAELEWPCLAGAVTDHGVADLDDIAVVRNVRGVEDDRVEGRVVDPADVDEDLVEANLDGVLDRIDADRSIDCSSC